MHDSDTKYTQNLAGKPERKTLFLKSTLKCGKY
jgi:hypothetical protein